MPFCAGYDFAVYGALAENIGVAFFPGDCGDNGGGSGPMVNATTSTTSLGATTVAPHECVDDNNLIEVRVLRNLSRNVDNCRCLTCCTM